MREKYFHYISPEGKRKHGILQEMPSVRATEQDLQVYLAKRSHEAATLSLSREERAVMVASTVAAIEATQYAQDAVVGNGPLKALARKLRQKKLYTSLFASALEVSHAFNDAFTPAGDLVEESDVREAAFQQGVGDKPKEINQTRLGNVVAAAGIKSKSGEQIANEEALHVMQNLKFADILAVTDAVARKGFHLEALTEMTKGDAFAILDDVRVVAANDRSRETKRWGGLDSDNPSEALTSNLSSREIDVVKAGLLLGHVDWGVAQVYKAVKENKSSRIAVYGYTRANEITRVAANGEVKVLPDEEVKASIIGKDVSVSYNPLDTTILATYVKFVRKLEAEGYTQDISTAARLRTAFEIVKDAEQFKPKSSPRRYK